MAAKGSLRFKDLEDGYVTLSIEGQIKVLLRARALIARPGGWVKGSYVSTKVNKKG